MRSLGFSPHQLIGYAEMERLFKVSSERKEKRGIDPAATVLVILRHNHFTKTLDIPRALDR